MTISEEIIREIYRLVREEGYHPNLSGIQEIRLSHAGQDDLFTASDSLLYLNIVHGAKDTETFYGIPVKVDGRQKVKFRVICKPTDD